MPLTLTLVPAAIEDGVTVSMLAAAASCSGATVLKINSNAYVNLRKCRTGREIARRAHGMCIYGSSAAGGPEERFEDAAVPRTLKNDAQQLRWSGCRLERCAGAQLVTY